MDKILDIITAKITKGFIACEYDESYGKVTISNRPDLCDFQCNGALAAAKKYKKAPMMIATDVLEKIKDDPDFESVEAVNPGFLNIRISNTFLADYANEMASSEKLGLALVKEPKKIVIDYGGPNVAKPLHVGHLRSAIIGESIKRNARFLGHDIIGDIHLGDWGLQMGLIITELQERQPSLVYFDDEYKGDYPKEPPFTISELEEIYPTASKKSKEDDDYKERAMTATLNLQQGKPGYRALWQHILNVSVSDLKKNYEKLKVDFDLWNGESTVQEVIPPMVKRLKDEGYAHESEGALVVDVAREDDTKEIPPCMILKSDGASLYNTTDLATITERVRLYNPNQIIYVVDKRQSLYFEQIFRCARKTKMVTDDTQLDFVGFGTMNGKDGKPFKTRAGGVMRLESLLNEIDEGMYKKINENESMSEAEARDTSKKVALAAIKYGDLSNQATKDYIFDIDKFTSFEGNTGPYILYTIVRIKSILEKYNATSTLPEDAKINPASNSVEKNLLLLLTRFNSVIENSFNELAPHKICAFIYEIANEFNHFYHETKILTQEDEEKKNGWICLLNLTKSVLETCIYILGFDAPEKM
ncbi:arginyl-tRNA synthetase [Acetitomaculum ruminis DSM 5522]|uniref:Arginine--tRNA ligase n=1 Tax=Acetitomaculum ruminis DSM 5522 TaxID=1120918 RepID=A0A1I0XRW5_9FIRM|nr:arginine--tRNA ligase [Acetitomaculum ruminis]SFB03889.1 arginyl-tRNA synthetase [Acetitomaculum ruminis DSM 5522]